MIDPKDLRQITLSEFKIGGVFYLKNDNGTFSMCMIDAREIKDPTRMEILKYETKVYADKGMLFIRINKPWKSFSE